MFRTEHIGSLLRPAALLAARKRFAAGETDEAGLRAAEDDAIDRALRAQEATGIDVVSDGEFRRSEFRGGVAAAVSGLVEEVYEGSWRGREGEVRAPARRWRAVAPLTVISSPGAGEASFLSGHASGPYKITMPAPSFMATRIFNPADGVYSSLGELTEAFTRIIREAVTELIERGVPYIQFDNPGYAAFLDEHSRARLVAAGRHPQAAFQEMLAADRALLEEINAGRAGRDVTVGLHVCRGNNASLWMNEGSYDLIAEQLFAELPVDRFLLEFDDDRSGTFDCLRFIPGGKVAVLGLVSSKTPVVEKEDDLLRRLDQATPFLDPAQMAISPQCGFASHADGGNRLSAGEQYRKLSVTVATARRWFGG